jgi:hypothetical protein
VASRTGKAIDDAPLVANLERAGQLLRVDPGHLEALVAEAGLERWGVDAWGRDVWRWRELLTVVAAAGIEVPQFTRHSWRVRPTVVPRQAQEYQT